MQILYNAMTDLLYFRLDDRKQQVINKRITEDIVLDLGDDDRIVGIEILTLFESYVMGSDQKQEA
jgi:uncharacterized protein YuzE